MYSHAVIGYLSIVLLCHATMQLTFHPFTPLALRPCSLVHCRPPKLNIARPAMWHGGILVDDLLCMPSCASLFSKQLPHPLHHTILLRIIRVVFTRYLQHGRKRLRITIYSASYLVCDLQSIPCQQLIRQSVTTSIPKPHCFMPSIPSTLSMPRRGYTHMLVDKHNRNIFPLLRKRIKRPLNLARLGLLVDD